MQHGRIGSRHLPSPSPLASSRRSPYLRAFHKAEAAPASLGQHPPWVCGREVRGDPGEGSVAGTPGLGGPRSSALPPQACGLTDGKREPEPVLNFKLTQRFFKPVMVNTYGMSGCCCDSIFAVT